MNLMTGEMLCKDHQGNLSHYTPQNCKICKLEEDVKQMKEYNVEHNMKYGPAPPKTPTVEEHLNMAKKKIEAQHHLLNFTNDAKDRLKERIDKLEIDLYEALERNKELVTNASDNYSVLKSRNDALVAQNDKLRKEVALLESNPPLEITHQGLSRQNYNLAEELQSITRDFTELKQKYDVLVPPKYSLLRQANALTVLAEQIRTSIKKAGHL